MGRNASVLLVEDDPNDAELTMAAFEEGAGHAEFIHAHDGLEALEWLHCRGRYSGRNPHQRPRVILMDLKMPRLSGLELLRRIRADAATRDIPVVVLSSSDEESDISESYRLGANSYVRKTVDFERFLEQAKQMRTYWLTLNETADDPGAP